MVMVANSVLDASHAETAVCDRLVVCSAEPVDYADIANVALAEATLTTGLGSGDYTAADGDTSGRKVTVAQQADLTIDTSGEATHLALADSAGTELKRTTTVTAQQLTSGGTVTVPAHDYEIEDPTVA